MKALKVHVEKNTPERVEAFEKGAKDFAKKIAGNFKDFEFVSLEYACDHNNFKRAM